MKRLAIVVLAAGLVAAGCNVKVGVGAACPSGYHRLDSKILHRPTDYCAPDQG